MSLRKSMAWSYGSQAFILATTFGSSVVLARLLSPAETGLFAFAMAITGVLAVFTQLHLGSYIVREGSVEPQELRAIFTLNALMNIALTLLMVAIAVVQYYLLDEPEIAMVLLVSSVTPLFGILEFVPVSLYAREINYALLSRVGIVRTIINVSVILGCAFAGLSALSLAIGPVVAGLFTATFYTVARWRDTVFRPSRKGFRPALIFGLQMMSISGLAQIAQRLSDIVLGRMLGLTALGLYTRASNLAAMMWTSVYGQATGVVFARLSEDLRTKGTLHDTFLLSVRMITGLMWPMIAGIAVFAKPIVFYLYGERWLPAAAPLTLLMITQFIALGFAMNWELFVLRRETGRQAKFELFRAVVGLGLFTLGCFYSITAAAAARVAECVIGYLLYRPHIDRLAGVRKGELERIFGESLMLTTAAVGPSLLFMGWSRWAPDAWVPGIVTSVLLGIGGWLLVLAWRDHPVLAEIRRAGGKALTVVRA